MKISIKRTMGKWLINGKKYSDLVGEEKKFFDQFIVAMRYNYDVENPKKETDTADPKDYVGEKL